MVARRLMKPGDEVQIRTPNAVTGVRGYDGIIEVTTLPDGRPQTSLFVGSGEFEVTTPSTRPIAMAESVSDVPSGVRLAQARFSVGPGNVWIATGPPGLQLVLTRFAPDEVNRAFEGFTVSGVTTGRGAGKSEPNEAAILAASEAFAQSQTLKTGEPPAVILLGVLTDTITGQTIFSPGGFTVITPLTTSSTTANLTLSSDGNAGSGGGGAGFCARPPCGQGQGIGPPFVPPPFPKPVGKP